MDSNLVANDEQHFVLKVKGIKYHTNVNTLIMQKKVTRNILAMTLLPKIELNTQYN